VSVSTFFGQALCQILAITWVVVEFLKLSPWMKESILGVRPVLKAFLYPLFAIYPKKGASPRGGVGFQCHSPGSQGRS
jgi:hypothetical protein